MQSSPVSKANQPNQSTEIIKMERVMMDNVFGAINCLPAHDNVPRHNDVNASLHQRIPYCSATATPSSLVAEPHIALKLHYDTRITK